MTRVIDRTPLARQIAAAHLRAERAQRPANPRPTHAVPGHWDSGPIVRMTVSESLTFFALVLIASCIAWGALVAWSVMP